MLDRAAGNKTIKKDSSSTIETIRIPVCLIDNWS